MRSKQLLAVISNQVFCHILSEFMIIIGTNNLNCRKKLNQLKKKKKKKQLTNCVTGINAKSP
jgi:hypothetical protein